MCPPVLLSILFCSHSSPCIPIYHLLSHISPSKPMYPHALPSPLLLSIHLCSHVSPIVPCILCAPTIPCIHVYSPLLPCTSYSPMYLTVLPRVSLSFQVSLCTSSRCTAVYPLELLCRPGLALCIPI